MTVQKILVTGANGLLGRHVLLFFKDSYEVHAIVHLLPENQLDGVTYYTKDFNQEWTTDDLPNDLTAIFHLAQSDLFREFPLHAVDVFNVNVTSTMKLLDFAYQTGVRKFVFTSTGGIYDSSVGAVSENSPINTFGQLGNYFATKLCSEILTHNYTRFFDVTLLRLFFMYGKGQKRSMLLPRLVDNVKHGRPIRLTANGGIVINPIHVSDVVNILSSLLETKGSFTYNVAGPEQLNLEQISNIIGDKLGIRPNFERVESIGENCIANIDFLESKVWKPQAKLEEKIDELFNA
jgi:nucleoside-diphosphate-sugar epimerase